MERERPTTRMLVREVTEELNVRGPDTEVALLKRMPHITRGQMRKALDRAEDEGYLEVGEDSVYRLREDKQTQPGQDKRKSKEPSAANVVQGPDGEQKQEECAKKRGKKARSRKRSKRSCKKRRKRSCRKKRRKSKRCPKTGRKKCLCRKKKKRMSCRRKRKRSCPKKRRRSCAAKGKRRSCSKGRKGSVSKRRRRRSCRKQPSYIFSRDGYYVGTRVAAP
ncbi:hypothetical protein AAG570_010094 [Ranatra chinensis]|uniref:Uncharacterized protein n=1 Tax=Ranatra chinensis TaxID=642074 RepID=A0ABD0YLN1_9HEMI